MDTLPVFSPDLGGLLSLLVTVILPLIVGLVTSRSMSGRTKALLLAGLAIVKTVGEALLANVVDSVPVDWAAIGYGSVITFVIAAATYYGLFKPTGATEAVQRVGVTDREEPKAAPAKRTATKRTPAKKAAPRKKK